MIRVDVDSAKGEGSGPNEGFQGLKPLTEIIVYMDAAIEHAKDNK